MTEATEFENYDMNEDSEIRNIQDHTLDIHVNLNSTTTSFKYGSELHSLKTIHSKGQFKTVKRSSSHDSETESRTEHHTRHCSFKSITKIKQGDFSKTGMIFNEFQTPKKKQPGPGIPKSTSSHTYKYIAKKFEDNFNEEAKKLEISSELSKSHLVSILTSLGFLSASTDNPEVSTLFHFLSRCPTLSYLKSLLQAVVKIKDDATLLTSEELSEIRDRFPGMYSSYFKAKRKSYTIEQPSFSPNTSPSASFTYKIIQKQLKSREHNCKNQAEQLVEYQRSLEERFERSTQKINKEKYKECTFRPSLNKKSIALDASPRVLKGNRSVPYITLKETKASANRTDILYEFAEVSRNLKKVRDI